MSKVPAQWNMHVEINFNYFSNNWNLKFFCEICNSSSLMLNPTFQQSGRLWLYFDEQLFLMILESDNSFYLHSPKSLSFSLVLPYSNCFLEWPKKKLIAVTMCESGDAYRKMPRGGWKMEAVWRSYGTAVLFQICSILSTCHPPTQALISPCETSLWREKGEKVNEMAHPWSWRYSQAS